MVNDSFSCSKIVEGADDTIVLNSSVEQSSPIRILNGEDLGDFGLRSSVRGYFNSHASDSMIGKLTQIIHNKTASLDQRV